jgi:hypothetical protein
MKNSNIVKIIISLALIGIGTLALLANLNIINSPWMASKGSLIWLFLFGMSGLAFVGIYISSKENWWAVIPGLTFIGLGIIVGDTFPPEYENIVVAAFMALLGMAFLAAYAVNRKYWGLFIPTGILITLALQTVIAGVISTQYNGAIFLLGISLTFLSVYFAIPTKSKYILSVAPIFGFFALIDGIGSYFHVSLFFPALLVLVGGYVVWRAFQTSRH